MAYSFKALIDPHNRLGQSVGQSGDKPSKVCPIAKRTMGQDFGAVPVSIFADIHERTAIVVYDGEMPERWALAFAVLTTATPIPSLLDSSAWRSIHDGAGAFLNRWAAQLDRLGWSVPEVLGVDPENPQAPWTESCLLAKLRGRYAEAVTADGVFVSLGVGRRELLRRNGHAA